GRTDVDDVDVVTLRAGLRDRAAQDVGGARAPHGHLDAVLRLEGLDEGWKILVRDAGVERQCAFMRRRLRRRQACRQRERDYRTPNSWPYSDFHLSYSSSETFALTNVIGILLSGVSIFLLVGTNSRLAMICCPSGLSSKS